MAAPMSPTPGSMGLSPIVIHQKDLVPPIKLEGHPEVGPEPTPFDAPLSLTDSPVQTKVLRTELAMTDLQAANTRGRLLWEKQMKDIDLQRRYQKVSVIMIHWEEEGEAGAQEEVDRLKGVLTETYHFTVREKKLSRDGGRSAQIQIHKFLADFVYDEDAPGTLLIVYYAGHGTPEYITGRLLFAGGNMPSPHEKSDNLNYIVWNEAEQLVRSAQRADIFLILDCCHAGKLLTTRQRAPWSDRIFEFLGASGPDQTTPLPGSDSFTSALIWALEELAKDGGDRFMSSELLTKILNAPNFPKNGQLPCLSDRGVHSVRRLMLEPLPEPHATQPRKGDETKDSFEYCLDVQFLLPRIPDEDDIRNMCDGMKELIHTHNFLPVQIHWKNLCSRPYAVERVVREWVRKVEQQTLRRKFRTLSTGATLSPGGFDTKQQEGSLFGLQTSTSSDTHADSTLVEYGEIARDDDLPTSARPVERRNTGKYSREEAKQTLRAVTLSSMVAIFVQGLQSRRLQSLVVLILCGCYFYLI